MDEDTFHTSLQMRPETMPLPPSGTHKFQIIAFADGKMKFSLKYLLQSKTLNLNQYRITKKNNGKLSH